MFIVSVRPSVCPSICLKPKFGRLKTKFDDDAGSAKRSLKTKFGPTFYVFYYWILATVRLDFVNVCTGILPVRTGKNEQSKKIA